ncbi:MAG: YraN family protein [Clostridia bacterium]|nr:YraN family protein [Clostridia bacterium]
MERENKRRFGTLGEAAAADYLQKNGYTLLGRNFRFGRCGEIDIIAREGETVCFIEVKTRTSTVFGMPSEAVDYKKKENITRLAQIYMLRNQLTDTAVRFDVVEIIAGKRKDGIFVKSIEVIKNAF